MSPTRRRLAGVVIFPVAFAILCVGCSSTNNRTTSSATTSAGPAPTKPARSDREAWTAQARAALVPLWARLARYQATSGGLSFDPIPTGEHVRSRVADLHPPALPLTVEENTGYARDERDLGEATDVVSEALAHLSISGSDTSIVTRVIRGLDQFSASLSTEAQCRSGTVERCDVEEDAVWQAHVQNFPALQKFAARIDRDGRSPQLVAAWQTLQQKVPVSLTPESPIGFDAPLPVPAGYRDPPCTVAALTIRDATRTQLVSTPESIRGWRCANGWAVADRSPDGFSLYELLRARRGEWWPDYPEQSYAGAFGPLGVPRAAMDALSRVHGECRMQTCFVDLFPVNWSVPAKCSSSSSAPFFLISCGVTFPSVSLPTTTVPEFRPVAASIRSVDFQNFTYAVSCPDLRHVTVVNGRWTDPHGPTDGDVNSVTVVYGDATGKGQEDALVTIDCSFGVSTDALETLVYSIRNGRATDVAHLGGSASLGHAPGTVVTSEPHWSETDSHCCPSSYDETTYRYDGRSSVEVSRKQVPASG